MASELVRAFTLPGAAALSLLVGCSDSKTPAGEGSSAVPPASDLAIRLIDRSAESGLRGIVHAGANPPREIVEVKGTGLGLVDVDGDGAFDVFVPGGADLDNPNEGPGASLYLHTGGLRFEDATERVGLDFRRWGQGVAAGDVDGDGRDDIYIAAFGRDALLVNRPGPKLVEETETRGLGSTDWGTGCALADLDLDGDLDLYVVQYLPFDPAAPPPRASFLGVETFGGPIGLAATGDLLYQNDGAGHFRDVTATSGVGAAQASHGLGVVVADLDDDGHQDIYVGNDSMPNQLFRGLGGMVFEEVAGAVGVAVSGDGAGQATMGIALADVDDDGRADIFSTNFADDTNTLLVRAAGDALRWRDQTRAFGLGLVSRPFLGWGTVFADLDQDGDEDLVAVNGHVYGDEVARRLGSQRAQQPLLFECRGPRFERVEPEAHAGEPGAAWLAAEHADRSLVAHDFDGDGDLDLLVLAVLEPLRLLENVSERPKDSLRVELSDGRTGRANRRGIGARIELHSGAGETQRTQVRWLAAGGSYFAQAAPVAHFGVPAGTGPHRLVVRWPDGFVQERGDVNAGTRVVVERPAEN
ncbi:MAG: hypothetical protein GC161_06090 [Planctomycetaceae bacterium]|nr:hypothetical protein [Planctomycetaceae bacterium]